MTLQFGKSMTDRSTCLERWRASTAQGIPILGAGAGTGISAKCAEAAGADLIIIYNSGRYRMAGRGSLAGLMPYVEMAREVLPIVRSTPVLAGVCGTDPFRVMDLFLRDLKQLGFSGVQNFPTVGLIDGLFRENLEETGMGYIHEVEMIARAHELDLITCPYVFNDDEARAMAKAGADLLIAHMGLTTKGTIGARTAITLDQAVDRIQSIQQAAASVHPEILVLCHGGPIAEPEDVQYVLDRTQGVCGFFGASSIERLPTERAITEQVHNLKNLKLQTERSERSKHV
jgi:predicted TIM-barrel enzyme